MSHFMVRWLKLSLVVVVGCGFLAMMIYALVNKDEIRTSEVEPPLIVPPSEPLKRRPDQPGGLQIPNRDKLVFDLLDSSNTTLGETGVGAGGKVSLSEVIPAVAVQVSESVPETEAVEVAPVPVAKPVVVVSPAQVAKTAEIKTETKTPLVEKKPEPKPVEAKTVMASGKWAVQLAAVNSLADGNTMAAKAAKDFAALKGLSPRVAPAPGGKKYRVQFSGLKDREAAAAICAKLAGRQACFPVAP